MTAEEMQEILEKHIDPHCFIKSQCMEAVKDAMTEYSNLVSKGKDEQLAELREKVNTLTIDNMAHEYNQAEAERFAPEYKRQIEEPLLEQLEALRDKVWGLEKVVEIKERERSDWANMCISKQKIIDSLKEHEEYFNETLACLDCDVKSLEQCVGQIIDTTEDEKIKELIHDTLFHLCKNMK